METVQSSDTEAPISSEDISSVASELSEEVVSTDPNTESADDAIQWDDLTEMEDSDESDNDEKRR
jgi:hypothetical protein